MADAGDWRQLAMGLSHESLATDATETTAQVQTFGDFLVEDSIDSTLTFEKVYDLATGEYLRMPSAQLQQTPRLGAPGLWMFIGQTADGRGSATVYNLVGVSTSLVWFQALLLIVRYRYRLRWE